MKLNKIFTSNNLFIIGLLNYCYLFFYLFNNNFNIIITYYIILIPLYFVLGELSHIICFIILTIYLFFYKVSYREGIDVMEQNNQGADSYTSENRKFSQQRLSDAKKEADSEVDQVKKGAENDKSEEEDNCQRDIYMRSHEQQKPMLQGDRPPPSNAGPKQLGDFYMKKAKSDLNGFTSAEGTPEGIRPNGGF